jgi:hypothetical protein
MDWAAYCTLLGAFVVWEEIFHLEKSDVHGSTKYEWF